jgi:hypothetical protein
VSVLVRQSQGASRHLVQFEIKITVLLGSRLATRGIDDDGNVANFIEVCLVES